MDEYNNITYVHIIEGMKRNDIKILVKPRADDQNRILLFKLYFDYYTGRKYIAGILPHMQYKYKVSG